MENSLKKKAVASSMWSSIQQFGRMGISFVANLIMARLLTPDDYGAIGMLMVFVALSMIFIDSGFGNALIQKPNPSQEDYSTIFFFNLMVAVLLYFVLYVTAPAISRFYDMDILTDMLRVLGLILIINAFSLIQSCRLRKQLDFKALTISMLTGQFVGAAVGIFMAFKGCGVWSLVMYDILDALIKSIMLWIQCKWKPKLVFWFSSLKELFRFGGFLLANALLVTLRKNALSIVLGKLYSARDLGMYTQARKLESIPVHSVSVIIGHVTFPVFSKLQDNIERLKNMQRKSLIHIAFLCIPMLVLLIVVAEPLILVLYTDKWIESVPYLQILCFMGVFGSLQEVNANVVNAMGKSKLYFLWTIVKTIVMFLLIWAGSYFGIFGLLFAMVVHHFVCYVINAVLASKITGYTLWQQFVDFLPIVLSSGLIAVAVWFIRYIIHNNFILLAVQSILFVGLYIGIYYFIDRKLLLDMLSLIPIKKKKH